MYYKINIGGCTVNSDQGNRWFYRMDSDERSTLRGLGLLVTGFGAVVTLMVSSFSHGFELMFGLGPATVGLGLVLFSFIPIPKPLPSQRRGIFWSLILVMFLIDRFRSHIPANVGRYVGGAFLISMFLQWFLRPAPRPLEPTN